MLEDLRLGVGVGGASPRTQQEQWQGVERALYKMTKLWEAWGVYPPAFLRVSLPFAWCMMHAVFLSLLPSLHCILILLLFLALLLLLEHIASSFV